MCQRALDRGLCCGVERSYTVTNRAPSSSSLCHHEKWSNRIDGLNFPTQLSRLLPSMPSPLIDYSLPNDDEPNRFPSRLRIKPGHLQDYEVSTMCRVIFVMSWHSSRSVLCQAPAPSNWMLPFQRLSDPSQIQLWSCVQWYRKWTLWWNDGNGNFLLFRPIIKWVRTHLDYLLSPFISTPLTVRFFSPFVHHCKCEGCSWRKWLSSEFGLAFGEMENGFIPCVESLPWSGLSFFFRTWYPLR